MMIQFFYVYYGTTTKTAHCNDSMGSFDSLSIHPYQPPDFIGPLDQSFSNYVMWCTMFLEWFTVL